MPKGAGCVAFDASGRNSGAETVLTETTLLKSLNGLVELVAVTARSESGAVID